MVLFRLINKEFTDEKTEIMPISLLLTQEKAPDFIKRVYTATQGSEIFLRDISCGQSFRHFLEYLYCDKFVEQITNASVKKVVEICKILGLNHSYSVLKKKSDYAKIKIH